MDDDFKKPRIAAVVVTFNRLSLLQLCINSIRNQNYKLDEIIVVNNSSSDGTLEWLNAQKDLTVITQENTGGAGGFHTGIKFAYEKGYDWIWCFDDDCFAEINALTELVDEKEFYLVKNSIVLVDRKGVLSFGLFDIGENKCISTVEAIKEKKILFSANFFNGTLLNKRVIEFVGLPSENLFIKGDEYEYYLRLIKNNINPITIRNSVVYHPPEHKIKLRFLNFQFEYIKTSASNKYYHFRNIIWIYKKYNEYIRLHKIIKDVVFEIIIDILSLQFQNITSTLHGVFCGIRTNLIQ